MYYHLLRSEYVGRYGRPLCADAFSPFMSRADEDKAAKEEVSGGFAIFFLFQL